MSVGPGPCDSAFDGFCPFNGSPFKLEFSGGIQPSKGKSSKIRALELTFSTPSSNSMQGKWHKKVLQFFWTFLMVRFTSSPLRLEDLLLTGNPSDFPLQERFFSRIFGKILIAL